MNEPDEKDYRVYYEKYLPKKKKRNKLTLFLGVLLALVLAGGSIFRISPYLAVLQDTQQGTPEKQPPFPGVDGSEGELPDGTVKESADGYREGQDGYVPSSEDEYYQELADDPNTELPYTLKWFDYSYEDGKNGVSLLAFYPEIAGEKIPHLDSLNETIRLAAVQMMARYKDLYGIPAESDSYYDSVINGFVTYKSEEMLSIVFWENIQIDDSYCQDLFSLNIDLLNGQIMDNSGIVKYDRSLAQKFRELDRKQNGSSSSSAYLSDEELLSYLADSRYNIIFYTPVGLEIGYNYMLESGEFGYTTVTLKQYGNFVKQL